MSDVVELKLVEVGEGFRFEADKLLEAAKGQSFGRMVIVADNADGSLWVSGTANAGESMILLERAKQSSRVWQGRIRMTRPVSIKGYTVKNGKVEKIKGYRLSVSAKQKQRFSKRVRVTRRTKG